MEKDGFKSQTKDVHGLVSAFGNVDDAFKYKYELVYYLVRPISSTNIPGKYAISLGWLRDLGV